MSRNKINPALALAALGVVYGDIGTSPLYTLQTCFNDIAVNQSNVLGVISLIFWSLIIVVSTCYLSIFLNASNDGEGGVLALLALFDKTKKSYRYLFLLGVFGAGLLISDGMLTPAVSVMGAMEGLNVISPHFSEYIVPLTVGILLVLFACQRLGTQKIGGAFGPILLVWFIVIAALGLKQIILYPKILLALNPYYALHFFDHNGFTGFLVLGCVFLAITGAEALYADLGQFGKAPIRLGWYCVVLPGCVLNFFGQGAHLLTTPSAVSNPFYYIAPSWFGFPLLILAAAATIIASQAIISASYSLTKQGILLGVIPRIKVVQTSTKQTGQIYVPLINVFFAAGCIFLVLFFRNSNALTNAYGIAINMEMVIMACLVTCLAYQVWKWSILKIASIFGLFIFVDLAFLASNIFKIPLGGWMPLAFAWGCLTVMLIWYQGMALLRTVYARNTAKAQHVEVAEPSSEYVPKLTPLEAVFITGSYDQTGECFFHYFDILQARPKRSIIVTVQVHTHPHVNDKDRFTFSKAPLGMCHLTLHFGFMEAIDIPSQLKIANQQNLLPIQLNLDTALYFIENIALAPLPGRTDDLFEWQKRFFIFMFENTVGTFSSLEFLKLPQGRTVTIGTYAEL
ncbi:MAG: KUP/HAK/KT family potassium transporter [Gammaproteobacteria bacterium]|nr:KUP/HAK/KT family potassium transporter [Gammaproteobacteria bacterium]